jgi:hypothetical protein
MKQTLYDILEVSRDASFEDIEVAYARRFEKLKGETSWDSSRLVMLNEAREVLSDAARRAAYDASLEMSTQQPEARIHSLEIEDAPRSSAKWIVAAVIVLAVVTWWVMRDTPPPAELAETLPPEEELEFQVDSEEETLIVLEGDDAADFAEEEILSEIEAEFGLDEEEAEVNEVPGAATEGAPAAATTSPAVASIVGFWSCFDPVTGRTSEYRFADGGSLNIRLPGGQLQPFRYETTGRNVDIVDSDPPRTLVIEELAARRMVLSSGAGQRLVCSR